MYSVLLIYYLYVFFLLMVRRPPIATRPVTLFPYTTLFRSPASTCVTCRDSGSPKDVVRGRSWTLWRWFACPGSSFRGRWQDTASRLIDRKSTRLNSSH